MMNIMNNRTEPNNRPESVINRTVKAFLRNIPSLSEIRFRLLIQHGRDNI